MKLNYILAAALYLAMTITGSAIRTTDTYRQINGAFVNVGDSCKASYPIDYILYTKLFCPIQPPEVKQ